MTEEDNGKDGLQSYLLSCITEIIRKKEESKTSPIAADMVEIQNKMVADARDILNKLCRSKFLKFNRTVNSVMFEFNTMHDA